MHVINTSKAFLESMTMYFGLYRSKQKPNYNMCMLNTKANSINTTFSGQRLWGSYAQWRDHLELIYGPTMQRR